MSKEVSISLSYEAGTAEAHDRRDYTPENAERSLAHRNVSIIACADVAEAVNKYYGPAIRRYNDKQKRADRKKSEDYYHALLEGTEGYGSGDKQERPVLEYVLQVGNKDDNGVTDAKFDAEKWRELKKAGKYDEAAAYVQQHLNTSPDKERLKEILIAEVRELPKRYPNLHVVMAEYHDDEPGGTGHVHLMVSPFVTGCKQGLDTRVSLSGAMRAMYPGMTGTEALDEWKNDVKDRLTEALQAEGYDRKFMSNEEQRLSVSNYKRKKTAEGLEQQIAELQVKEAQAKTAKEAAEKEAAKAEAKAKQIQDIVHTMKGSVDNVSELLRTKLSNIEDKYLGNIGKALTGAEEAEAGLLYKYLQERQPELFAKAMPAARSYAEKHKQVATDVVRHNAQQGQRRLEDIVADAKSRLRQIDYGPGGKSKSRDAGREL